MEFVNQSLQFSDGYPSQYDEHGDILERVVEGCESEISDSQPDSRYFREPIASSTAIHGSLQSRSRSVDPLASSTMIEAVMTRIPGADPAFVPSPSPATWKIP